jgi:hypothetical protein
VSSLRANKEKTKAFRCVSYLDKRIFGTNVKVEARRWFIIGPNAILVVHIKDVSYTSFVLDDILSIPIHMKKNTLKFFQFNFLSFQSEL